MKTIYILLLFVCFLVSNLFARSKTPEINAFNSLKSKFDRTEISSNNNLKSATLLSNKKQFQSDTWEYSLMSGGYFTLGTNHGSSVSQVDDHCQVSFGHPYALTSYAYLILDNNTYYPGDLQSNLENEVIQKGDTLVTQSEIESTISCVTKLNMNSTGNVELKFTVINNDVSEHQVSLGLLFDAALGKWGDGFAELNGTAITQTTKITNQNFNNLVISERGTSPKGIRVQLSYAENIPSELTVGNWEDEYYGTNSINELYDLAIQNRWNQTVLQPSESASFTIVFQLLNPDYNNQLFIRSDLPTAMAIMNNQLFPGSLSSTIEIINNGKSYSNLNLAVTGTEDIEGWQSETSFAAEASSSLIYSKALIKVPEIYNSVVVPVTISLLNSDQVMDELTRNVFIPAAPFSKEGLDVVIDSNYTKFQKMFLRFHCLNQTTNQTIYNLGKNNILFYENQQQRKDFSLDRDTTGGTNNADIVFVLDVTGSMSEEIAGVRDNIIEFCDSLSYKGINFNLGMVTFLDVIENIYPFTSDVQLFQEKVSQQFAHEGADQPENSLQALMTATQFSFRQSTNRIVIWITDADYHIHDSFTNLVTKDVTDALVANGIKVFCIGDPQFQTQFYDPIVLNTGGSFFDIKGNFRDILLEVSRFGQSPNFLLSFVPSKPVVTNDVFKVEIHYSGLGGADSLVIKQNFKAKQATISAMAFPNPVLENTMIQIDADSDFIYEFTLFNNFGKQISTYTTTSKSKIVNLNLTQILPFHKAESSSIYILRINAISKDGKILESKTLKLEKL